MSLKFAIRSTAGKSAREGESFIRFTGSAEPYSRGVEREARVVETDSIGNPTKWEFNTGLDDEKVEYYKWFSDEEKEVVKETIKNLRPKIEKYYGGAGVINPNNYSFWKKRADIAKFNVNFETIDIFYDTEKPEHALLYLSIIGGAFSDVIAPNKDWAELLQIPHFLALEIEDNRDYSEEEDITRSDAHGELAILRKEFGKDALYILAWCLQYDTNAFGAYTYNVSEKDLINYHIKYIDGKLVTKKKKNMPKTFIEYAEKWKGTQTRQLLYTEAYVKAGEYFNFISQREKKYVTFDGTILGNTVEQAVKALMSPKFNVDFETLRDKVEAKWKE